MWCMFKCSLQLLHPDGIITALVLLFLISKLTCLPVLQKLSSVAAVLDRRKNAPPKPSPKRGSPIKQKRLFKPNTTKDPQRCIATGSREAPYSFLQEPSTGSLAGPSRPFVKPSTARKPPGSPLPGQEKALKKGKRQAEAQEESRPRALRSRPQG